MSSHFPSLIIRTRLAAQRKGRESLHFGSDILSSSSRKAGGRDMSCSPPRHGTSQFNANTSPSLKHSYNYRHYRTNDAPPRAGHPYRIASRSPSSVSKSTTVARSNAKSLQALKGRATAAGMSLQRPTPRGCLRQENPPWILPLGLKKRCVSVSQIPTAAVKPWFLRRDKYLLPPRPLDLRTYLHLQTTKMS